MTSKSWALVTVRLGMVCVALLALVGCEGGGSKSNALVARKDDDGAKPLVLGGGRDDTDPAVVAVLTSSGICTGTLIAPKYVLTARHCVADGAPVGVSWRSRAFSGARTPGTVHLMSRSRSFGDDIAIVELAQASSVKPIPVNLRALDRLSEVRVVGYGLTGTQNDDAGIKRSSTARAFVSRSFVESSQPSVCYGDSGGPALARIDGHEQVVGVTSHHLGSSCESGRSRFVRTDVHRAFLAKFVDTNDAPAPRDDDNIARNDEPKKKSEPPSVNPPPPVDPQPGVNPPIPPIPPIPGFTPPNIDPKGGSIIANANGVVIIRGADGSIRVSVNVTDGINGINGIDGSDGDDGNDSASNDDDDEDDAPTRRPHARGRGRHPHVRPPGERQPGVRPPNDRNGKSDRPNDRPGKSGALPSSTQPTVTIYSADYCHACKIAKAWMTSKGIAYVERRVDHDPRAEADYERLGGTGLPTYEIAGEVRSGHDPAWVERTIRAHSTPNRS